MFEELKITEKDIEKLNLDDNKLRTFNCGGYAFNVEEWYAPYESSCERMTEIQDMYEYQMSKEKIFYEVLECDVKQILHDFPEYTLIKKEEVSKYMVKNTEIIAYRNMIVLYGTTKDEETSFITNDEYEWPDFKDVLKYDLDMDFHFKVYRNGRWSEKNGGWKIKDCDIPSEKEPWVCGDLYYDGPIAYFIRKEK